MTWLHSIFVQAATPMLVNHHHHHPVGGLPPLAMLGGIATSITNSLRRLKEGSKELFENAKELGSLR